jgi:hypothetical protein
MSEVNQSCPSSDDCQVQFRMLVLRRIQEINSDVVDQIAAWCAKFVTRTGHVPTGTYRVPLKHSNYGASVTATFASQQKLCS